jgi:WD40 repeat protein
MMAVALKGDETTASAIEKFASDVIAVFQINQVDKWQCLIKFSGETTDLLDLKFTRDNQHLVAWDSSHSARIQVFKILGNSQKILAIQLAATLMPKDIAWSGVSSVKLNRTRSFVFAGHFDEQLRMYNTLSWREMFAFDHSFEELTEYNTTEILNIYYENESADGIYYEALNRPFKIPRASATAYLSMFGPGKKVEKCDFVEAKRGISLIAVSFDDRFCATKNEATPNCVWVWDLQEMCLNSLIVQASPIADLAWCPRSNNLNISTNSSRLFLWSPKGASVCQVPVCAADKGSSPQKTISARSQKVKSAGAIADLTVSSVAWNPNGLSFAALDKNQLVFVYPQTQFFDTQTFETDSGCD